MRRPIRNSLGLLLAATAFFTQSATARVGGDSAYSKAQTYSGALRYLRVDLGYEVVEKDPDSAYLVFRYAPPGQPKSESFGTVEVVEADEHVRVFVRIPRMPEYHERVLRDGLLKKLREEYGVPAPRVPSTKEKPEPDAGSKPDAGEKD